MTRPKIRPCSSCQRSTRPAHSKAAEFPDTTVRVGEKCETCYRGGKAPAPRPDITYTIAGLNSFLARRREREAAMIRREYYAERISA